MVTTIQLDEDVKEKLDRLKVHHRETYNELLSRMIDIAKFSDATKISLIETIDTLSNPEDMRDIAQAIEEYNSGKVGIDFDDLKRELKLNV